MQRKWKRIAEVIGELKHIMEEGIERLSALYLSRGIKPEIYVGKEVIWKAVYYLNETTEKIDSQQKLKNVSVNNSGFLWAWHHIVVQQPTLRYYKLVINWCI